MGAATNTRYQIRVGRMAGTMARKYGECVFFHSGVSPMHILMFIIIITYRAPYYLYTTTKQSGMAIFHDLPIRYYYSGAIGSRRPPRGGAPVSSRRRHEKTASFSMWPREDPFGALGRIRPSARERQCDELVRALGRRGVLHVGQGCVAHARLGKYYAEANLIIFFALIENSIGPFFAFHLFLSVQLWEGEEYVHN